MMPHGKHVWVYVNGFGTHNNKHTNNQGWNHTL